MSDFLQELKYKLEPIKEKLGMGDKPIGRLVLYVAVVVVGFGVLLWAIIPNNKPLASNARIPEAAEAETPAGPEAPPRDAPGGSRVAPGADG